MLDRHRPSPTPEQSVARIIALTGLALIVALVVVFAFKMVLVLFAGVLLALLLRALAEMFGRALHVPPSVMLVVLIVAWLGASVAFVIWLAPQVVDQLQALADQLPKALRQLQEQLRHSAVAGQAGSSGQHVLDQARESVKSLSAIVGSAIGGTLEIATALIVIFFVGIYGAAQPATYVRAALSVVPRSSRERCARVLVSTGQNLRRWLLGRLLAMLFVGVTTSIAFKLFAVPLWLILGIFAGLLTFVEYAGALISAIPPLLLTLAQGRPATAAALLGLYTALHVIEGYLLTPLLARASVHVPPALGLAFQALLGVLVGPLGLTFATPLFAVGISAVKAWRAESDS